MNVRTCWWRISRFFFCSDKSSRHPVGSVFFAIQTSFLFLTIFSSLFVTKSSHSDFYSFSKKFPNWLVRGISKETSQAPSKLNTQAFRYVPCNTSRSRRCAKTFRKEVSEKHLYDGNPGSYRQAMTIAARTMILLYGAAGEPSRGEIPVSLNADRRLIASHSVWGLRTNYAHD